MSVSPLVPLDIEKVVHAIRRGSSSPTVILQFRIVIFTGVQSARYGSIEFFRIFTAKLDALALLTKRARDE